MDKILSGQAFLYRGGTPQTVIETVMTDNIRGGALSAALARAVKRYPYLTGKFVEKNGDFYLQDNAISLVPAKTEKFRTLGSMASGYHLVDVTYFKNVLRVSFHHALCDGQGIKPFVETLVYYYSLARYGKNLSAGAVRLTESPLLAGETKDPYESGEYAVKEFTPPPVVRDGYALPENETYTNACFKADIGIEKETFLSVMKEAGATPAVLTALLLSKAIAALHPDFDKPIVCSLAADRRAALNCPNTHRNCVGSIYLPYSREIAALPLKEQAAKYRETLAEQRNGDFIRSEVNRQMGMFKKLENMKTQAERQEKLSVIANTVINTFVLSYMGQFAFGGAGQFVNYINLFNSGTRGVRVNMSASDKYFTVNILADFPPQNLADAFTEELRALKIPFSARAPREFDTGKDKTHKTAPRQAERYYKKLK